MISIKEPLFLITIDTEGDNLWSRPREIRTENAKYLPRFQQLCERFGLKPTYLTNYEMAKSPVFQELARDAQRRNQAEVGMHLHAWNSPPLSRTDGHHRNHPYLIEFPEEVMRSKIAHMTDLLESTFSAKMVSHRAGRWAFNEIYAKILVEHGYLVDCSVTPHVSWTGTIGGSKSGGVDYSAFSEEPYFLSLDDISKAGNSPLLEVPMTVRRSPNDIRNVLPRAWQSGAIKKIADVLTPPRWLRPGASSAAQMIELVKSATTDYVEFMLHSSEFMPGGSPNFQSDRDIEKLYDDLTALFEFTRGRFVGATLSDYHQAYVKKLET